MSEESNFKKFIKKVELRFQRQNRSVRIRTALGMLKDYANEIAKRKKRIAVVLDIDDTCLDLSALWSSNISENDKFWKKLLETEEDKTNQGNFVYKYDIQNLLLVYGAKSLGEKDNFPANLDVLSICHAIQRYNAHPEKKTKIDKFFLTHRLRDPLKELEELQKQEYPREKIKMDNVEIDDVKGYFKNNEKSRLTKYERNTVQNLLRHGFILGTAPVFITGARQTTENKFFKRRSADLLLCRMWAFVWKMINNVTGVEEGITSLREMRDKDEKTIQSFYEDLESLKVYEDWNTSLREIKDIIGDDHFEVEEGGNLKIKKTNDLREYICYYFLIYLLWFQEAMKPENFFLKEEELRKHIKIFTGLSANIPKRGTNDSYKMQNLFEDWMEQEELTIDNFSSDEDRSRLTTCFHEILSKIWVNLPENNKKQKLMSFYYAADSLCRAVRVFAFSTHKYLAQIVNIVTSGDSYGKVPLDDGISKDNIEKYSYNVQSALDILGSNHDFGVSYLIMREKEDLFALSGSYKNTVRYAITEAGYKILFNIGDNEDDFSDNIGAGENPPESVFDIPLPNQYIPPLEALLASRDKHFKD